MAAENVVAAFLRRRPLLTDALIAFGVSGITLPPLWWGEEDYVEYGFAPPDAATILLTVLASAALVLRRRRPVAVLALTLAITLVDAWRDHASLAAVAALFALYAVASCRPRTVAAVALVAVLATFTAGLVAAPRSASGDELVSNFGMAVAAWALGRAVRVRRAYVAELEHRAESLQATRVADTRAVVAEERARIARELHDVVAHHVSVMTVQASAAQRTLDRDPGRSREAMAAVEHTGRAALVEMRRIVGVLRQDEPDGAGAAPEQLAGPGARPVVQGRAAPPGGAPDTDQGPSSDRRAREGREGRGSLAPQPRLADLHLLLEGLAEAGLAVDLVEEGEPRPLDAGVDLTAFRVVQEALTNTLKHGATGRARVVLGWTPGALQLRVLDDGRGAAAALATSVAGPARTGHGLLGMRERIALHGGTLRAGPRVGGGYEVAASIPFQRVDA